MPLTSILQGARRCAIPSSSTDEPSFRPGIDTPMWTDSFDSYVGITTGSPRVDQSYSTAQNDGGTLSLVTGRSGAGQALRATYGVGTQPDPLIEKMFTSNVASVVVKYWFRPSTNAIVSGQGMKFFRMFLNTGASRWHNWTINDFPSQFLTPSVSNSVYAFAISHNQHGPCNAAQTYDTSNKWASVRDANWHRSTMYRETNHRCRWWIDGVLKVDTNYYSDWPTDSGDVFKGLHFPSLFNGTITSGNEYTLDIDDLEIYSTP